MTTRLSDIPRRARRIRYAECTSPDRAHEATLAVYTDNASHGYQTDYEPVPTAWYAVVGGVSAVRLAWRYSGRRYDRAERDYQAAVTELRAAGWTVAE